MSAERDGPVTKLSGARHVALAVALAEARQHDLVVARDVRGRHHDDVVVGQEVEGRRVVLPRHQRQRAAFRHGAEGPGQAVDVRTVGRAGRHVERRRGPRAGPASAGSATPCAASPAGWRRAGSAPLRRARPPRTPPAPRWRRAASAFVAEQRHPLGEGELAAGRHHAWPRRGDARRHAVTPWRFAAGDAERAADGAEHRVAGAPVGGGAALAAAHAARPGWPRFAFHWLWKVPPWGAGMSRKSVQPLAKGSDAKRPFDPPARWSARMASAVAAR